MGLLPEEEQQLMPSTTFRYNEKTCQYERERITFKSVLWYCLGLVVTAACLLVAILFLHDWLINTEREVALRKENKALVQHHASLTQQLAELQPLLASLEHRDKVLHEKFFGTPPSLPTQDVDRASKENLLIADGDAFRDQVASLSKASDELIARAQSRNHRFGRKLEFNDKTVDVLRAMPTAAPVEGWQPDRLISGFGMRVNPFHKGLYEHLGVDIAMPRGTPVKATAAGKVTQLKRSDLEAGYGNYIEIDHGNGITTRYAHLDEISVRYGAKVAKGDVVGTVGSSGGSVAPHIHYEILRDGKNVDPIFYMVEGLSAAEHHLLTIKSHQQNQSLD